MKCIQSIKASKNIETGMVARVSEIEAESKVKSGYWKYVPKSEWKSSTRKKTGSEAEREGEKNSMKSNTPTESNEASKKSKKTSK